MNNPANNASYDAESRAERDVRECCDNSGFDWNEFQYLCDIADYWDMED